MVPIIAVIAVFSFIFVVAYYLDYARAQSTHNQRNDQNSHFRNTQSKDQDQNTNLERFKKDAPSKSEFQSFEDYDDFFEVDDDFFDDYSKDLKE